MRPKGFTLVELLVVVAIIALLVMILMPTLGRARALAKDAHCKSNLWQLWEVLHVGAAGAPLSLPPSGSWMSRVFQLGAGSVTRCKEDTEPRSGNFVLGDIWLEQWPSGHGDDSNLAEIIYNGKRDGDPGYSQVSVQEIEPGMMYEVYYSNPPAYSRLEAHSHMRLTMAADGFRIESIIVNNHPQGCMSSVKVWRGAPHAPGSEELLQLTGMLPSGVGYNQVDPRSPVVLQGFPGSYAYNTKIKATGGRPGQVLLLEYTKLEADVDRDRADWQHLVNGQVEYTYLAPRHLGKLNAVMLDGSVGGYWPEDLHFDDHVWQP